MPSIASKFSSSLALALAAAVGLAACSGAAPPQAKVGLEATPNPAGLASSSASGTPFAQASGGSVIDQGHLASSETFGHGEFRFDPPVASQKPNISAAQAYASFQSTGLYPNAARYSTPAAQFSLYTEYGAGSIQPDGSVQRPPARRPVWLITVSGVPDSPSGGGSLKKSTSQTQVTVIHDIVAVVDASTGRTLDVISTAPDSTVYPAPKGS